MLKRKSKTTKKWRNYSKVKISKRNIKMNFQDYFDIYPNGISELDIKAERLEYQERDIKELRKCIKLKRAMHRPKRYCCATWFIWK